MLLVLVQLFEIRVVSTPSSNIVVAWTKLLIVEPG